MGIAQISHTEKVMVYIATTSYPHPEGTFHRGSMEIISNQSTVKVWPGKLIYFLLVSKEISTGIVIL